MSEWMNDHDEWMQQFNMMVNDALGVEPEAEWRDEREELSMSDIAAKLMNGKIELPEAVKRVGEWLAGRMGFKLHRDQESFDLEMAVGNYVEITDGVKQNLLQAGEVGIADALLKVYGHPQMLVLGPGDVADIDNPPGIGVTSKSWFDASRLHPREAANLHWAVTQALKEKLSE